MMHGNRIRWRKAVWLLGAKLGLALAVAIPRDSPGAVSYWLLDDSRDVVPGAPVTMSGRLVGRVTAKKQRGDTTFLRVQFNRGAYRLSRGRVVWLRRWGLEGMLSLEIVPSRQLAGGWVGGSERLPVIVDSLSIDPRLLDPGTDGRPETTPPFVWRPIPLAPPASASIPPRAT